MATPIKIMIVAGEDSGDRHAANLVKAIRELLTGRELYAFGATGARMRTEGVETVVSSDDFGIVGVPEVIRAVPMFFAVMRRLIKAASENSPDLVILVDFPEFNLKLAKKLKRKGFRVVYYISPQLWAWRRYRVRGIRKYVDLLLTILPFELDWYKARGVAHVRFVGSPLVGTVKPKVDKADFCAVNDLNPENPIVALLPGSRAREVEQNLPLMLEAARKLKRLRPETQFVCGLALSRNAEKVLQMIDSYFGRDSRIVRIVQNETYSLLNASDAAAVKSGTATLETAIIGTPQVIVYRTSALNYFLIRPLVSIDTFGLANLIAGKKVFRELIQDEFTAATLCGELDRILVPETNSGLRAEAKRISDLLGRSEASDNAAREIISFAGWAPEN